MRGRAAYPFYSLFADPDEVAVVAGRSHEFCWLLFEVPEAVRASVSGVIESESATQL